jgi:hypothetical protein
MMGMWYKTIKIFVLCLSFVAHLSFLSDRDGLFSFIRSTLQPYLRLTSCGKFFHWKFSLGMYEFVASWTAVQELLWLCLKWEKSCPFSH